MTSSLAAICLSHSPAETLQRLWRADAAMAAWYHCPHMYVVVSNSSLITPVLSLVNCIHTHIWAGETPFAPCSIFLYQKHSTSCSSSSSSSPVLNPLHQLLKQVTGNEDVSASCPQPGNSLITFPGLNEWDTCLSGCVKERTHALVTLAGSRSGISAVLTPNCLKEIIRRTHYAYRCWTEALLNAWKSIWRGQVHWNVAAHTRAMCNMSSESSTPSSKIWNR